MSPCSWGDANLSSLVIFESSPLMQAMFGSVFLPWPESMLRSLACGAAKDHMDAQCLRCNLWPCWHRMAILLSKALFIMMAYAVT